MHVERAIRNDLREQICELTRTHCLYQIYTNGKLQLMYLEQM